MRWNVGCIRMKSMLSSFAGLAIGLASTPALAAPSGGAEAACVKNGNGIEEVEQIFEKYGVSLSDPCPEQSRYDTESAKCERSAKDLQDLGKELQHTIKETCRIAEQIKQNSQCDGKQKNCQDKAKSLNNEAKKNYAKELSILKELRSQLKDFAALQARILEGAKKIQESTINNAASNPNGKDMTHVPKLERARGTSFSNNQQSREFFKDSLSTVSGILEKVRSNKVSREDVDQIQTPLTREPVALAAAGRDLDEQIAKREQVLQGRSQTFQANAETTGTNAKNLGASDIDGGKSSGGGDLGNMSQLAQAGSGLAGAAGGGQAASGASGGSDMSSLADSSGGGVYAAAGSDPAASATGGTSTQSGDGTNLGAGGTFIPGAGARTLASTGNNASSRGTAETGKIAGLEKALGDNSVKATDVGSTGASTSRASALRDALRARLADMGTGSGGGGSTGASMAPGGGTGSAARSGAVPEGLLPVPVSVQSDNALEASSGSTGGDLGNTDFSLAGSETDAAVQGMLSEFGLGDHGDGERSLASVDHEQAAPEILSADSGSLFIRARETHQRSLKKGLVINGLRAKL